MSDVVLRWEVDDATAQFATGKVESEEFNKGGFKWTAAVVRRSGEDNEDRIDFALRCVADHDGPWKCEAELDVVVLQSDGGFDGDWIEKEVYCFDQNCSGWMGNSDDAWSLFTNPYFNINDKVTIEFRIRIISFERVEVVPNKFAEPNEMSNVILKIGDEKLHVSKELLSVHSPVFKAIFFGDYAEKGKKEIELKDIVYEEFLDVLHVIYVDTMEITDRTLPHIMKLADRFQMERVMNQAKKHLMQTEGFDVMKKLLFADQYRLDSLKDQCLHSFTSAADITAKIKSSPEYAELTADMKAAICDRIAVI